MNDSRDFKQTEDSATPRSLSRRTFLRATAGTTGMMLLAACAPSTPSEPSGASKPAATTGPASKAAAPVSGGQIVFTSGSDPITMNPAFADNSSTIYYSQPLFDGLTRPDDNLRPSPSLAESWEVSDDGLNYTFNLRRGVKFHDGQELTSADVKFSWETISHPVNKSTNKQYFNRIKGAQAFQQGEAGEISGITTPDDYTVVVDMEEIYAPFLSVSAFQPILPSHIYGAVPIDQLEQHETARAPVGTGPFKFVEWRAREAFTMDAHKDYWGGAPKIDRLIIRPIADATTIPSLLRSGDIDATGLYRAIAPQDMESFQNDPNFKIYEMPGYTNWYTEFNLTNPLFQDVNVRRALIHAIDREGIVANYLLGHGKVVDTAMHPNSWAYTEPTTNYEYSPEKAKALLSEAGWTPGSDGILTKDGQRFSFEISTFVPDYPELLQEQWRQVGVESQITRSDFPAFWGPIYQAKQHQVAALHTPYGIYPDPSQNLDAYYSSELNRNSYQNPQVDQLIEEATATLDEAERKRMYAEFLELMSQDAPHMWVAMPNEIWGTSSRVRLPEKNLGFLMMTNIKDWERTA